MLLLDIAISGKALGLAVLGIMVGILALIYLVRMRLRQQSEKDLASTFDQHKYSSPLEGRNKYPEVDAFKYSNTFFNLGLAISLGVIVLAFGWTQYESRLMFLTSLQTWRSTWNKRSFVLLNHRHRHHHHHHR
jgi:protein TonB